MVICTDAAAAAIVILEFAEALLGGELESVTLTVNEDVPTVLGIPVICPELLSASPAGKDPELIVQL